MGTVYVKASSRARAYTRQAGSRSAKIKRTIKSVERHVLNHGNNLSAVRTGQLLRKTRNNLHQTRVRNLAEKILKRQAKGGLSMKRSHQLNRLKAQLTTQQYRLKY